MVFVNRLSNFGRRMICKLLGHTPESQQWMRTWRMTDVTVSSPFEIEHGYSKGHDIFCKRCGVLLERVTECGQ